MEQKDIQTLFKSLDYDLSGAVDFDEFLRVVVGDMNESRRVLVEKAFRTLDVNQDGCIDLQEFSSKYNAKDHPEVKQRKKTEEEVLKEFMQTFESHHQMFDKGGFGDGKVTFEEFYEYYNNISCNIDNDQYFDLMMTNAWGLGGANDPASIPYAGCSKKVAMVNARDAYRKDHHRNIFGTDSQTPFTSKQKGEWNREQMGVQNT